MLLRFGCSNHLSIRSFQEVSFLASALKDDAGLLNAPPVSSLGKQTLACAVIYGANASGKSNFLKALLFMRQLVVRSHVGLTPEEEIGNVPFLLEPLAESEPSQFECDFVEDGIRYSYGFAIQKHKILREFLYAFPKGHRQVWFSRDEGANDRFVFSKNLKGRNTLIGELTRSNSLFLSAAAQQNHVQLSHVYGFFANMIEHAFGPVMDHARVPDLLEGEKKDWVLRFLKSADIGISDSTVAKEKLSDEQRELILFVFDKLGKKNKTLPDINQSKFETRNVSLGHRGAGGKLIYLPWESESSGTRTMLSLLVPVLYAIDHGGIAVIDEIDASLHTLVAMRLVELFKSP